MNILKRPKNANGYCLYRGVPVSKVQLRIAERLKVPEQHINYPVGYYYADIAFPKDRIIIEYNGWHWHQKNVAHDQRRTGFLLDQGWNLIIIKSEVEVPTMAVLKQALYRARKGERYQEIVLRDWGGQQR